jgi:hypothetical protein
MVFDRKKKLSLDDAYSFDHNEGIIYDNASKPPSRLFVISAAGFEAIVNGVYKNFGTGGGVILDKAFNGLGVAYANSCRDAVAKGESHSEKEYIENALGNALGARGWGRLVAVWSPDKGAMSFDLKNCIFCSNSQPKTTENGKTGEASSSSRSRTCIFYSFASSLVDVLLIRPHSSLEERCMARGDDACRVAVKLESPQIH